MPMSKAQVRAAYAVLEGKGKTGMPRSAAQEITRGLTSLAYSKLPERKHPKGHR